MVDHGAVRSSPVPHRDWRLVGLVAAGGAVGSTLRYLVALALPAAEHGWPWATFAVNLVGAFLLGWLLEGLAARGPEGPRRQRVRLVAGTGVLGGFTTYSSFALELDRLLVSGNALLALGYAVGTVALGMLAALLGVLVAVWLRPHAGSSLRRSR